MVVQGTSVVQVSRQSSLDQGVTRRVDATRRVIEASGLDRGLGPVGAIVQGDRVQARGTAALVLAPVCAHSVGGCIRVLVWRLVELVLGVESWAIWPNHVLDFPASSLFLRVLRLVLPAHFIGQRLVLLRRVRSIVASRAVDMEVELREADLVVWARVRLRAPTSLDVVKPEFLHSLLRTPGRQMLLYQVLFRSVVLRLGCY